MRIERHVSIHLNFLNKSKSYTMNMYVDGVNSDKNALDYKERKHSVNSRDIIEINMGTNGGFAAMFTKD